MTQDIESFSVKNTDYPNNCVSCIGGREENQDSCAITMTRRGFLAVVCDGMGGMNGGEIASRIAAEEIIRYLDEPASEGDLDDDNQMALRKAVCSANLAVRTKALEKPSLSGMGTTVTAVLINDEKATIAYVGDSRIYQIRKGKKKFRTFDHSMVFEMVKEGVLTEEQARLSAQSNIILRALGTKDDIEVETYDLPYDKGDIFFLCSDGIWGTMPEKELIKRISLKQPPKAVTEKLAAYVNNLGIKQGGRHDNLTAAMLVTTGNSKLRSKMEDRIKKVCIALSILLTVSVLGNCLHFLPKKDKADFSFAGKEYIITNIVNNGVTLEDSTYHFSIKSDNVQEINNKTE